jgi:ferric-dicitrate binding protein FerR (iron transport regulator)
MKDFRDNEMLARYLSGENTQDEKTEVENWIHSDPENKQQIEKLKKAWAAERARFQNWDTKRLWAKIAAEAGIDVISDDNGKILLLTGRVFSSRLLKIAAVLLLTVSLPYFYIKVLDPVVQGTFFQNMVEITVAAGEQETILLPDGSKVVLDSGSKFSYPEKLKGNTREVFLQGEGYFEVAHNPDRPFVVRANDAVVKVLGTKFNVRAWDDNGEVRVAVAEGSVSLRSREVSENEAVVLTEGQLSILIPNVNPLSPVYVDINKLLGWQNREIMFENAPLHEILSQLTRWYKLDFKLADQKVLQERLTIHIENKPVDDILELIGTLIGLNYELKGNTVTFGNN